MTDRPGFALPLLLLQGFRELIDALHSELGERGHPDVRPVHGFVLQAVGDGTTAGELAERLGVTKQAAAKHVATLESLGYLARAGDPEDGRKRIVALTEHGYDCLRASAEVFDELRARWGSELGEERLAALEDDLERVTSGLPMRVDVPGWLGG